MGSLLVPVIAGIFMVKLEKKLPPELLTLMTPWFRYVDDIFIKLYVLNKINRFDIAQKIAFYVVLISKAT